MFVQVSLFTAATPLISLLARGIRMSAQERDELVPQVSSSKQQNLEPERLRLRETNRQRSDRAITSAIILHLVPSWLCSPPCLVTSWSPSTTQSSMEAAGPIKVNHDPFSMKRKSIRRPQNISSKMINSHFFSFCSVWMPFSLGELVNMSQHLRDISLGLVELAFPDSRPSVREDYR